MKTSQHVQYYPEIPALPKDLQDEILSITKGEGSVIFASYNNFLLYPLSQRLKEWALEYFPTSTLQKIQKLEKSVDVHIDMDRKLAYNFLIDAGGNDVHTKFFDSLEDGATVLEDHVLKTGIWHSLTVDVPHSVENITGTRIAFSLAEQTKLSIKAYRHARRFTQNSQVTTNSKPIYR